MGMYQAIAGERARLGGPALATNVVMAKILNNPPRFNIFMQDYMRARAGAAIRQIAKGKSGRRLSQILKQKMAVNLGVKPGT